MVHVFRDLKASLVAGDLVNEGYFGDDYQYFGCAYWQESNVNYFISPDPERVYNIVEQKLGQGIIVTPVLEILRHLKIADDQKEQICRELKEELEHKLDQMYPLDYFAMLAGFTNLPEQNTAYPLLEQYKKSLSGLTFANRQAFAGLVNAAHNAQILTTEHSQILLRNMVNEAKDSSIVMDKGLYRELSGFVYLHHNTSWQYYSNGYHSRTIEKKIQLTERNILTTPILKYNQAMNSSETGNLNIIKNEFLVIMHETFDEDYLTVLQEIQALPTPVKKEAFIKSRDAVEGKLGSQALTSIMGYGFLWHVY